MAARGGGGKIAIGGGAGLVVIVLALLFGVNPGDILGGQPSGQQSDGSTPFAQCTRGSDIAKDRDCRFVAYTNSIQDYWGGAVKNYQVIKVQTFTGSIDTACGNATSAVGPFYCPGDTSVYLDLGFFDELTASSGPRAATRRRRTCWPTSSGTTSRTWPAPCAGAGRGPGDGTEVGRGPAGAPGGLLCRGVVQARDQ